MNFKKMSSFLVISSILLLHTLSLVKAVPAGYQILQEGHLLSSLSLQACPDDTIEGELTVTASSDNTEDCRITISWDAAWLYLTPTEFVLAPGGSRLVAMRVHTQGMDPGYYSTKIVLQSNCKPGYSEIPVMLEVLAPVFRVDPPKDDWKLPFEGTIKKEIKLTNSICKTLVSVDVEVPRVDGLEIIMSTTPFTIGAREMKTFPITFRCNGFEPEKAITLKLIFTPKGTYPVFAEYRLIPEEDVPLIEMDKLPESLQPWNGQTITVRGFLHRGAQPFLAENPMLFLPLSTPNPSKRVMVVDPLNLLQWNPWEQSQVVFADLKGVLRAGSRTEDHQIKITEAPALHFPVLYPYPRPPEETLPSRRPVRASADYLVIVGSAGHPVPEWMERDLMLKWEAGMSFNGSERHMRIFFGDGTLPLYANEPGSIAQRKDMMKPYLEKGRARDLMNYFKTLEDTMRGHLRKGEIPSLTLLLTGNSQLMDTELIFQMGGGESLRLEPLAQALERLSILGPVRIELNTSYAESWLERLNQIGNTKNIMNSSRDLLCFVHEYDAETQISRWLGSGQAGRELGEVDWLDLAEQVQNPFAGEGLAWEIKMDCLRMSHRQSRLSADHVWITYQITVRQFYRDYRGEVAESQHKITLERHMPQSALDLPPDVCPDFNPMDALIQNPIVTGSSTPVEIEGEVHRVHPERESFELYDPFFDVFKEVVFPERPLPVSEGDRVRVTGTEQGERRIIPTSIEVMEKSCGFMVRGPENLVLCPTCLSKDYSTGYGMDYQDLKWTLSNVGEIGIGVSWNMEIEALTENPGIQLQLVFPEDTDNPIALAPEQSYDLEALLTVSMVPEEVEEEVRFRVTAHFGIAPAPPCIEYESWSFEIIFCPNKRNINGKVTFKNVNDVECPLKDLTLRMYLRFDPECGHDTTLRELIGNIPDLHESANEGLPDFKYYLETRTNKDGEYSFSFIDKDCDHRYRIMAIFESSEIRMNYHDCSKRFFAYGDISGQRQPCKETDYERHLRIGIEGDLKFPSNFNGDPRAVAQSWCHMQECFDIFRSEKCNGNNMIRAGYLPVNVCIYSNTAGTFYRPSSRLINIETADSAINSTDRPMNREWHEFGHFLHDALCGIPARTGSDLNHDGFRNASTLDSFLEGLAEMTSMLILRQLKMRDSCCDAYAGYANSVYRMSGGAVSVKTDSGLKASNGRYGYWKQVPDASGNPVWRLIPVARENLRVRADGTLVDTHGNEIFMRNSQEELAVAGLMLDLMDNAGWYDEVRPDVVIHGEDPDGFSLPKWQDLYCMIRDNNITNIKGLYDALRAKYQGNASALAKIDAIFEKRGFFEDKNFNGSRDPGEAIGTTYRPSMLANKREGGNLVEVRIPAINSRPNHPLTPGLGIKILLQDAGGNFIPRALLRIDVIGGESATYFTYQQWVSHGEILYLYLSPDNGGRFRVSLAQESSQVFIVTEKELWEAVNNEEEHAGEYRFIVGGIPEPGSWDWDSRGTQKLRVVQGRSSSFGLLYWNTGTKITPVRIHSSETWLKADPEELSQAAGRIKLEIDASKLSPGKYQVKLFLEGAEGIEKTSEIEVEVLPGTMVIQLRIGDKKALVEGREVTLDAVPFIRPPGRTMVPLRLISEGFGAMIDYAPKQGLVTDIWVLFQATELYLKIGSPEAEINGEKVSMDAPAEIVAGRTFVPIRFISEAFGAKVDWEASTQTITIRLAR